MTTSAERKTETRANIEQIADEHRALEESVNRLAATTDLQLILPRLMKLKSQLEHHFESEEGSDGVRQDVVRNAPYLLGSLDEIFAEHREFLADIDTLHQKAKACLEGPVAEILNEATALTRRLRDHEIRETELLNDVYYTDYGTGAD